MSWSSETEEVPKWLSLDLYLSSKFPKPINELTLDDRRAYCELHNIELIDPHAITRKRRTPEENEAIRILNQEVLIPRMEAYKQKWEEEIRLGAGGGVERILAGAYDPNPDYFAREAARAAADIHQCTDADAINCEKGRKETLGSMSWSSDTEEVPKWLSLDLYLSSKFTKPINELTLDERRAYCELHNIELIDPHAITRKRRTPEENEAIRIFNQEVLIPRMEAYKQKLEEEIRLGAGGGVERILAGAYDPSPAYFARAAADIHQCTDADVIAGYLLKHPRGDSTPKPEEEEEEEEEAASPASPGNS